MTDLVAVVHAWSEANSNRFELDGVAAEIPPVSTFSTGEATRFVLRRGAVKLQVFAWDTGDFVLHIEDAAHTERKSTLAIKIKTGDEAVPIIEDRYSRVFAKSKLAPAPAAVGPATHRRRRVHAGGLEGCAAARRRCR